MFLLSYDVGNCHVIPVMLNSLTVHNNTLQQILQYTTANLQKSQIYLKITAHQLPSTAVIDYILMSISFIFV